MGDGKLIDFLDDQSREFYDLRQDESETRNIAAAHSPGFVQQERQLQEWVEGVQKSAALHAGPQP